MPHSITDGTTEESSAGQMTHIADGSYGHYFYETKARREWIAFGCGLAASLCVFLVFAEWYQSDSSDRLFFAFLTYYVTQLKVRNLRKAKAFPTFPTSD